MIHLVDLKANYNQIREEINENLQKVLNDTAFIRSKYVSQFEHNFANFIQTQYCIGVANGTDAIELALRSIVEWRA